MEINTEGDSTSRCSDRTMVVQDINSGTYVHVATVAECVNLSGSQ